MPHDLGRSIEYTRPQMTQDWNRKKGIFTKRSYFDLTPWIRILVKKTHSAFYAFPLRVVDRRVDPARVEGGAAFFLRVSFLAGTFSCTRFDTRCETRDDFLVAVSGSGSGSTFFFFGDGGIDFTTSAVSGAESVSALESGVVIISTWGPSTDKSGSSCVLSALIISSDSAFDSSEAFEPIKYLLKSHVKCQKSLG